MATRTTHDANGVKIANPDAWDSVVARNRKITAWKRSIAARRREILVEVVAEQQSVMDAWVAERNDARDRLVLLCVELQTSSLRDTRKRSLLQFAQWLMSGLTLDVLAEQWGLTLGALQRRVQRARHDLDAYGASEEDLFLWKNGGRRHNKPVLEAPSRVVSRILPSIY